jgi:hypothetical protein
VRRAKRCQTDTGAGVGVGVRSHRPLAHARGRSRRCTRPAECLRLVVRCSRALVPE